MNALRWPVCPLNGLACKADGCAWFYGEEKKCAIVLLPSTLDWLTRFAVTEPYEKTEDKDL